MSPRLDAHAHFFFPGYVDLLPESCRRQSPDEITLYQALAQRHEIEHVLAVGYEGAPWASGNNQYISGLASQHAWVRPLAFVTDPAALTMPQLATWRSQRFVGISLYLFTPDAVAMLAKVPGEIWKWLIDHAWLLSVNSTGEFWTAWEAVLAQHPGLRILIAHLGQPPAVTTAPRVDEARAAMTPVLRLAFFPSVYVKFSGFYALAEPGHAYPHSAALPYAQVTTEAFGAERIVWASDFSPALEYVSFPQTIDVLSTMSWLTSADLDAIYRGNLARLLTTIDERNLVP
jgi:L-fuconolactonase